MYFPFDPHKQILYLLSLSHFDEKFVFVSSFIHKNKMHERDKGYIRLTFPVKKWIHELHNEIEYTCVSY